jgi:hypothetical protein
LWTAAPGKKDNFSLSEATACLATAFFSMPQNNSFEAVCKFESFSICNEGFQFNHEETKAQKAEG